MASDDLQQGKMDDQGQGQPPVMPAVQIPYVTSPYQPNQVMAGGATQLAGATSQAQQLTQQQLSYQQAHQQQLEQQLQLFWANQYQEILATNDFKNHSLPLARIKKIMKADEDVRMIAAEAPVLFARACEMFILELTYRSWGHTEENKRRTLQKNDIAGAITRTDVFDFLVDIVPREEAKEEVATSATKGGGPSETLPYYYVPPQVGPLGLMMGKPEMDQALLYAQQPQAYIPQQMWEQQQAMQQHQQQQQPGTPAEDC